MHGHAWEIPRWNFYLQKWLILVNFPSAIFPSTEKIKNVTFSLSPLASCYHFATSETVASQVTTTKLMFALVSLCVLMVSLFIVMLLPQCY